MKKLFLLHLILYTFIIISCHKTCDCFDEDKFAIFIQFNIASDSLNSPIESFMTNEIDSCYLIKTEKDNLNNHLDTLFIYEERNWSAYHFFIDALFSKEYSFIIQNDTPFFKHIITEIEIDSKLTGTFLSNCRCIKDAKIDFKYDGVKKSKDDIPIIINK